MSKMSTIGMNKSTHVNGQLHHQSATAPSLATHAAVAVGAHQCHERDSDVIYTPHVKKQVNSILAQGIHSRFQVCNK